MSSAATLSLTPFVWTVRTSAPPGYGHVYLIRNQYNGGFYVGSTRSLKRRWGRHRSDLKLGIHHCAPLQRAWNKYGASAFEFRVVGTYPCGDLQREEQWWMDETAARYNSSRLAHRPTMSDESRAAMSAKLKEIWKDPARVEAARQRALKQAHPKGYKASDQTKVVLREFHRAKHRTYEAFGKVWSLKELAEHYGVKYGMLKARVRAGWSAEQAVITPKRKGGL